MSNPAAASSHAAFMRLQIESFISRLRQKNERETTSDDGQLGPDQDRFSSHVPFLVAAFFEGAGISYTVSNRLLPFWHYSAIAQVSLIVSVALIFIVSLHQLIERTWRQRIMRRSYIANVALGMISLILGGLILYVLPRPLSVPSTFSTFRLLLLISDVVSISGLIWIAIVWIVAVVEPYVPERLMTALRFTLPFTGLPMLLAGNYFLRRYLEHSDEKLYPFLSVAWPKAAARIAALDLPWWRYVLPMKQMGGAWNFNLVITHLLEIRLSVGNTWYLYNALIIVVAFLTAWAVFRSFIFSYTLAICLGFGTQLYHTYAVTGAVGLDGLYALYLLWLLIAHKILSTEKPHWIWKIALVLATILTAIQYEAWLDFLAFIMLVSAYLVVLFWRSGDRSRLANLSYIALTSLIIGVIYIFIKTRLFPLPQVIGSESDPAFNYPFLTPVVEDIFSKYLTYFYIAVSNFLPPPFIASNALYLYGPEQLTKWQYGYHQEYSYLVPMNYLFLWRFYAGGAFVAFCIALKRILPRSFDMSFPRRLEYIVLSIFLIMIATAGPTHSIVKVRPMTSVPLLGYQAMVGILGVSLLIAYLLLLARKNKPSSWIPKVLVLVVWCGILYGALTRPAFLGSLAQLVGINYNGGYPDPMRSLLILFGYV